MPEGAINLEQRCAIVKGVTQVLARVEGLPPNALAYVTVLINEVVDGG